MDWADFSRVKESSWSPLSSVRAIWLPAGRTEAKVNWIYCWAESSEMGSLRMPTATT